MWGFFLANTAGLWFCFALPLAKKFVTALAVNIPAPEWSAGIMLAIYWSDAVSGMCLRGHRDHFVNFSGVSAIRPACVLSVPPPPPFLLSLHASMPLRTLLCGPPAHSSSSLPRSLSFYFSHAHAHHLQHTHTHTYTLVCRLSLVWAT